MKEFRAICIDRWGHRFLAAVRADDELTAFHKIQHLDERTEAEVEAAETPRPIEQILEISRVNGVLE